MGDDEPGEYIYKFVSANAYRSSDRAANLRLLESGTLYVARFGADGSGEWIPLAHGANGLDSRAGFDGQTHVLVNARGAADRVGATPMDRPEWLAVHPQTLEVYCSLTNNSNRGTKSGDPIDAANPRAGNVYGHIVRWRETGGDPAALRFIWDIFLMGGDPAHTDPAKRGTIKGDPFGSPDTLAFDDRGVLWIGTDAAGANRGDYARLGNNQMLAADPVTAEVRRFLTGPRGCEVTGLAFTPDGRSMFLNIQHPGESGIRSDPAEPQAGSVWPDGQTGGRPRSATVAVRRSDGGVVGA
jgi:secreted PhoX family phosphatase